MEPAVQTIRFVRVTNRNAFTLRDHYDNRVYEFPQDDPRMIPLEAAAHMFGYTPTATEESARLHCIKRFGFNRPEILLEKRDELFWGNLEIVPVSMRMVETPEDYVPPVLAAQDPDPERIRRGPNKRKPGRPRKRVLTPRDGHPLDVAQPLEEAPAA